MIQAVVPDPVASIRTGATRVGVPSGEGGGCMHAEVVTALDVHLAEVQRLRRRLTAARAIEPGERLEVVLQIAASAQRLTHTLYAHQPQFAVTVSR